MTTLIRACICASLLLLTGCRFYHHVEVPTTPPQHNPDGPGPVYVMADSVDGGGVWVVKGAQWTSDGLRGRFFALHGHRALMVRTLPDSDWHRRLCGSTRFFTVPGWPQPEADGAEHAVAVEALVAVDLVKLDRAKGVRVTLIGLGVYAALGVLLFTAAISDGYYL